jgi:Fe-S-cluster-containing dehydrogenase component
VAVRRLLCVEACSGCVMRIDTCPTVVIQSDDHRCIAQKSTLCVDRLADGRQHACVAACLNHCIHSGTPAEVAEKIGKGRVWPWHEDIV